MLTAVCVNEVWCSIGDFLRTPTKWKDYISGTLCLNYNSKKIQAEVTKFGNIKQWLWDILMWLGFKRSKVKIWFIIFLHIIGWRLSVSINDMLCYVIKIVGLLSCLTSSDCWTTQKWNCHLIALLAMWNSYHLTITVCGFKRSITKVDFSSFLIYV